MRFSELRTQNLELRIAPVALGVSVALSATLLYRKHGSCYLHYSLIAGEALTRIIYDGSSRNRAVAKRDRRAEPRGREAYLKQYVDRLSGEPACLDAVPTASRPVTAANPRLQQRRS